MATITPQQNSSEAMKNAEEAEFQSAGDVIAASHQHSILFFDGVCGVCNTFIDFLLPRDRDRKFRFAPLQGETARLVLPAEDVEQLNSVVLLQDGKSYRKSSAVVRVLWQLSFFWKFFGTLFWLIPKPLRDFGYSIVARVRYRIFGKKSACRIPTADERSRFYE